MRTATTAGVQFAAAPARRAAIGKRVEQLVGDLEGSAALEGAKSTGANGAQR